MLGMMETPYFGYHQRLTLIPLLTVKMHLKTKRLGGSNICAVLLARKYMTWLGHLMESFSLLVAWTISHASTMRSLVSTEFLTGNLSNEETCDISLLHTTGLCPKKARTASCPKTKRIKGSLPRRADGTADSRAQSLRARSGLGPTERICCHAIFRSGVPYIPSKDERRSIYTSSAQQSYENGPTWKENIFQQPSTARISRATPLSR